MVNIKTQTGERDSKTTAIYIPLDRIGIPEALLKFLKMLNMISKGQDLSTGPQKYWIA